MTWDWEYETAPIQPHTQPTLSYTRDDSKKEKEESGKEELEHASESDDVPECDQGMESNPRSECVHIITFKCIPYQKALEMACNRLQEGFTVRVCNTPEPYDMYQACTQDLQLADLPSLTHGA